jgi:DNA replication protein DnaC
MPAPGYLSYSNGHADLLFQLVSRRYEHNSTIVTTNRPSQNGARSFQRRLRRLPGRSPGPQRL